MAYRKGYKENQEKDDKNLVIVIYDISNNNRRNRLFKLLSSYLLPVQKSAFEGYLKKAQIEKLRTSLNKYIDKNDSLRIYQLSSHGKIYCYGRQVDTSIEDFLII